MRARKIVLILVMFICSTYCVGCGGRSTAAESKQEQNKVTSAVENDLKSDETTVPEEPKPNPEGEYGSLEDILAAIESDTEATINKIKEDYSSLEKSIDSYDKYIENTESVKGLFTSINTDLSKLFEAYDKYYEAYIKLAIDTCKDNKELDRALDDFYDRVYGDVFDDIYDDVYNRVFDNYYDSFYNGVVEEGRDSVAYKQWSDVHSQCYSDYSDAHSAVYEAYSDAHTKCYLIYTNARQQLLYEGVKDYDTIMNLVQAELDEKAADKKRYEEQVDYTVEYEVRNGKAYVKGISGEGNHATISIDYEDCDVVGIDASAFEGSNVLSVTCWADIETIGDSAFKDCTGLLEFSVSNKAKVIGNHAFENCSSLKDLYIWGDPDIGESAFANCTSLTEVSIGSKTKKICDHAFEGCSALEKAWIWSHDTQIGKGAFANCPKLEDKPNESGESVKLDPSEIVEESDDKSAMDSESADSSDSTVDGIRPEFQKAMDEYVAFFEEYCEFMKTYKTSSNPAKLLTKYNDYLKQYTESMSALEELEGTDMSKEEQKLYLDTMNDINKMLIDCI